MKRITCAADDPLLAWAKGTIVYDRLASDAVCT